MNISEIEDTIEGLAEDLFEFATEEKWADMYPPDCSTPNQKVTWCLLNLERFKDMAAEAPFITNKVLQRVAQMLSPAVA